MDNDKDISSADSEKQSDFIDEVAKLAAACGGVGDLGFAKIDHARAKRCGFPEFIYGDGKTLNQLLRIIPEIRKHSATVLATRVREEFGEVLAHEFPEGGYDPAARVFFIRNPKLELRSRVAVVTAGSCDLPVALEAKYTLEACGIAADLIPDVGVAALPRLLAVVDRLRSAAACIVAAGMEGALPSVVAGLVSTPVIAVPTSIGYGAALHGISPLLGMLNSCASGLVVVNIDNGFGAGCAAARFLNSRLR